MHTSQAENAPSFGGKWRITASYTNKYRQLIRQTIVCTRKSTTSACKIYAVCACVLNCFLQNDISVTSLHKVYTVHPIAIGESSLLKSQTSVHVQ